MRTCRIGVWAGWVVLLWASLAAGQEGIEAITRPSGDVTLSFRMAGQIASILVKPGDSVEANDLLVQLDDRAERAQLGQLKAQADDQIRINAAQARLDQKIVEVKKIQEAVDNGAATELELETAKLDVKIFELSLDLARFQQVQDRRKYEETKLQVERMRLLSPIRGTVQLIEKQAGESADALEPILQVIATDPLWIDVPVPLADAKGLKPGSPARIVYPGSPGDTVDGNVTFVAGTADAASRTLLVRLEVANPQNRPGGQTVRVTFPRASALAAPSVPPGEAQAALQRKE